MKHTLLIIVATIWIISAQACKCAVTPLSEQVANADQIFIGTVIKKTSTDMVYFLFSISHVFKGETADTLTIKTGFGGGDCGVRFEIGKQYLVFSYFGQTSICRSNGLASNNPDIVKLRFLFDSSFSSNIVKSTSPILTQNEAIYYNNEFLTQRNDFDFQGKKISFVEKRSFIDKEQFFKKYGGKAPKENLIILTEEEKQKTKGYDAIIVLWRKHGEAKHFRKRIIKELT
jgi:hypothetical protein